MAIRLDEAKLRMLKIVDTSNTIKIYPNNITSYGGLVVEGYKKGGYNGIHLGPDSNYMTIMSDSEHQGLYNSGNGQWIIYYNRPAAGVGFGTTTLAGNNKVTIEGNATIKNLLTVANGVSHYGIKVGNTYINAIDGDIIFQNNNALRFGSDSWNWDEWAGLKYDWTNKRIYLGIADKNIFNGNSVMSGGRILTPGINHFHVGNQTTYYMTSDGDIKASSVTVDNNNSSGSIQLVEDGEGGTIRLYSKSNTYCYEIDAHNDETIRIHTATKNPNGTYRSVYWNGKNGNVSTDGTFYVQNTYPVMPLKLANGYYGMTLPDASDTNWIRTTNYGIIPYASGGSSALGTDSWPFNNIWSKTVNIIDTYYPAFRLTAQTVNSFSTYSKGMFEVNYTDSIGMWIHSDKTTDSKSRRALVVYGWGAKSDAAQAIALRQCDTSGAWLSDLYLLHTGNYSSYAMPTSYWSWSGQSGQPTWVWGGNDYGQYKVWNPANFNVNSAKAISSSGTITMISGTAKHPSGFTVGDIYSSSYPFSYGSTWRYQGTFGAELIFNGLGGDAGVGTGHMYFRTRSDWATSTWGDWKHLLDSSNYTTYTVTKTGTGASGTWGISVTGSAATLYNSNAGTLNWSGDHMLSSSVRPNAKLHFGTETLYQYRSSTYYVILDSGNYSSYAATASHTHSYLPLSGGTMTGNINFNGMGVCYIGNSTSDASPTVGGALCNLVISSWYGISFTTTCSSTYQNKTAIGFDCRTGTIRAAAVHGAVWNDYAEYRTTMTEIEPGRVVVENNDDTLSLSTERLMPGANIVSDTFGFSIGETESAKTPLAVSGRVLAYPNEPRDSYHAGDAVCSGPNGTVSKMTREEIITYPERIIGTVSAVPDYETWGQNNVSINGRIWIKV